MMRDNKPMEMIAEHLIAHILQRHGLLVTKPYFDQDGGDLFVMTTDGGVRYCRVQCKGRTVRPGKGGGSNVEIACPHVQDGMVVCLYVEDGTFDTYNLFAFFKEDVESWKKVKVKNNYVYRLTLSHSTFADKLTANRITEQSIERLANEVMKVKLPTTAIYKYTGSGGIKLNACASASTTGTVAEAGPKAKKK